MRYPIHGILLLDKPGGLTSNAALQKVKRLYQAEKAGHTGSLDPIATGMLPICFGEATKFSQFLLASDKSYYVVAKLGEQTTTGDSEGEVTMTGSFAHVSEAKLMQVMEKFLGESEQVPPMYSAIKYQGKPLYVLARKGIEIKREPRVIQIFSLQFIHLQNNLFAFQVHCSKGTYIRTLVEDIGRGLGCFAHVTELRRVMVAPYGRAVMYTLPALETIANKMGQDGLAACLLQVETAVEIFPAVKLSLSAAFYLRMGQAVRTSLPLNSLLVRLFSEDGTFLGIGEVTSDGRVKPHRLVASLQKKSG